MTGPRLRPRYWLHLPTGLAIDRRVSVAAKYLLAAANALPGGDPGTRRLAAAWPFSERTIRASWKELESSDVAAVIRRPGFRSRLRARGIARPGEKGRQRFARIAPELFYAGLAASSGRTAAYGPLLVSRLLRQQLSRGAAHVSPAVLAADLALKPKLVTRLLGDLEAGDVIERHRNDRSTPMNSASTPFPWPRPSTRST